MENCELFLGIGTGNPFYDKRRHLNIIFVEFMSSHAIARPASSNLVMYHIMHDSVEDAALFICNDILTEEEHDFLNLLRERYDVPDDDFMKIMGGIGLLGENRTPCGYSYEENYRLLIQMVTARFFMPQSEFEISLKTINTSIYSFAKSFDNSFDLREFQKLYDVTSDAVLKYENSLLIKDMEDYIIDRMR